MTEHDIIWCRIPGFIIWCRIPGYHSLYIHVSLSSATDVDLFNRLELLLLADSVVVAKNDRKYGLIILKES